MTNETPSPAQRSKHPPCLGDSAVPLVTHVNKTDRILSLVCVTSCTSKSLSISRWLKRHQPSECLPARSRLHAQTSEVAYCLDPFPSVPVNILITNQTACYNERRPRPSARMGKLCSGTAEIREPFAPCASK